MDTEGYVIYGMVFGFITLWLFFYLAKNLGDSDKFPKPNEGDQSEDEK